MQLLAGLAQGMLQGVPLWHSRVPAGDVTCELYCMAENVSACNLFSVWLLYKSIFLLALLSSAITSKLLA